MDIQFAIIQEVNVYDALVFQAQDVFIQILKIEGRNERAIGP